ncbi:MAG TPA: hypothetical protein VNW29_05885 [Candidatus Sulfotelmatobacter sp.]|jgi:hypothetical protein|nr:hypothetical protein [Candidatus Sulfotelmatobacter sp.]
MINLLTSPKFITITIAVIAILVIPLTIIEVQSQQNLKQNAEGILWVVSQAASTTCAADGSGANIATMFTNEESRNASTAMNVTVKDNQTGKSVNMGSIAGGATKTNTIRTGKNALNAGTVTFTLTWTDGHSGRDSRTASYKAINSCIPQPTPTPTIPPGQPTPTICPTLEPVKNVHIICPNCQLSPSPSP